MLDINMFKAVIFDIDGTLTRDIAWVYITERVGGSIEYNDHIVALWSRGEIKTQEAKEKMVENWSKARKNFKRDWTEVLDSIPVREDAQDTVTYLKEKGYLICMITGAFDIYADIVGKKVGISEWHANTKVIWDENDKLVSIELEMDDKAAKVEFFKKYCVKNNLEFKDCVVVGDSANDMGLFEITGNGIAVKTEFEALELEKIAWKKINNLSELKNIL